MPIVFRVVPTVTPRNIMCEPCRLYRGLWLYPIQQPRTFCPSMQFLVADHASTSQAECVEWGVGVGTVTVLALLDFVSRASVLAQASVVRPSSVNSGFSTTAFWIQAKFYGNYLAAIFPDHFCPFFKIFNF